MIKKDAFQRLKGRRIYQFYLDEETMEITDITSHDDFVQVIRCKDCKHGQKRTKPYMYCDVFGAVTETEWFCSKAERKEE